MKIESTSTATKPQTLSPEQEQLREAAKGFEAIMVRRLLEAARATSFAKDDTPLNGGGRETWAQMRDEQFAEIAANSGSFGFARSIEEQLAQYLPATTPETKPEWARE
ncbi:MAG: rod-binding protein [Pseudomonadota bacterium]